jgi:hypothetical protein
MEQKWVIFAVALWLVGIFLGATYDKVDIGTYAPITVGSTTVTAGGTLNYLSNFKNISYKSTTTGKWAFVGINPDYFTVLWGVMTWDFNFFNGGAEIFRYILLLPISVGVMFGIFQLFVALMQGLIAAFVP